jgi:hypothetical protein
LFFAACGFECDFLFSDFGPVISIIESPLTFAPWQTSTPKKYEVIPITIGRQPNQRQKHQA